MRKLKRGSRWSIAGAALVLVSMQLVPVARTNPPVEGQVPADAQTRAILRRACYDCHSHETVWPWYSRIAPASWLVAHDVNEGRDKLNFSAWGRLSERDRARALKETREKVDERDMPPWIYLPAHPDARLSADDVAILRAWTLSMGGPESGER